MKEKNVSLREEYRKFVKSGEKVIVLDRSQSYDGISTWKHVKNPVRVPLNFLVIVFSKINFFMGFTRFLLRLVGMKVGKNTGFAPMFIDPLCPELISIGDNCIFGWNSKILCHEFTQDKVRFGRVDIGNNVLVGAFSTIRLGVSIGDNSVLAMNSFANKDIPANEIWGGIPASKIGVVNK